MWNEKYSGVEYFYGKEPNEFLREQLLLNAPGKIFFPAEGEGRNAVFAATKGWQVDAVDISEIAREKAARLAIENSVEINYVLSDITSILLPEDHYDAIFWCYLHLPENERSELFNILIASLKPGGRFILEAFSKNQIGRTSGGPKNIDLLYYCEDITKWLNKCEIIMAEESEILLSEGAGHQGLAKVIRIVAIKK